MTATQMSMSVLNAEANSDELVDPLKVEEKIGAVPNGLSTIYSNTDIFHRELISNTSDAKIGQQKESEAALQHLRGKNADTSGEAVEIRASFNDNKIIQKL